MVCMVRTMSGLGLARADMHAHTCMWVRVWAGIAASSVPRPPTPRMWSGSAAGTCGAGGWGSPLHPKLVPSVPQTVPQWRPPMTAHVSGQTFGARLQNARQHLGRAFEMLENPMILTNKIGARIWGADWGAGWGEGSGGRAGAPWAEAWPRVMRGLCTHGRAAAALRFRRAHDRLAMQQARHWAQAHAGRAPALEREFVHECPHSRSSAASRGRSWALRVGETYVEHVKLCGCQLGLGVAG